MRIHVFLTRKDLCVRSLDKPLFDVQATDFNSEIYQMILRAEYVEISTDDPPGLKFTRVLKDRRV